MTHAISKIAGAAAVGYVAGQAASAHRAVTPPVVARPVASRGEASGRLGGLIVGVVVLGFIFAALSPVGAAVFTVAAILLCVPKLLAPRRTRRTP